MSAFARVLLSSLLVAAMPAQGADLKIVQRFTVDGRSKLTTEHVKYVKGERSRIEWRSSSGRQTGSGGALPQTYGPRRATIYQCDQRRVVELDLDAREYTSYELNDQGYAVSARQLRHEPSGGKLTVTIEAIDTGERKEMFGFIARNIIIRQKIVPGPGAVSQGSESEQRGWYIDLDVQDGCPRQPVKHSITFLTASSHALGQPTKIDEIEVHRSGINEIGFPVEMTTLRRDVLPNGASELVPQNKMEVVELTAVRLDPSLFEVPPDFKQVRELRDQLPVPASLSPQGLWERFKESLSSMFR